METLFEWNITYKNYLEMQDIYKYIHTWLKDKKYKPFDGIDKNYELEYREQRSVEGNKQYRIYWKAKKSETYTNWVIKFHIVANQTKSHVVISGNQQKVIPYFDIKFKIIAEFDKTEFKVNNEYLKLFEGKYKKEFSNLIKEEKDKVKNTFKKFLTDFKTELDNISIKV